MAERTTMFPVGRRIVAFRAVDEILRSDPALVNAGVEFRSWNGDQADGMKLSSGMGPVLRMSPRVQPNGQFTQGAQIANLGVGLELFVAGTIAEDIVGFWDAVEAALVGNKPFQGTTVQCYLTRAAGVQRFTVTQPAFGSWESQTPPSENLSAVGLATFEFLVPR